MNCEQCQEFIPSNAKFCPYCGFMITSNKEIQRSNRNDISIGLSDIANKINAVAGINTPIEIKFKEVFSNVLVKHSEEEAEELFFVGTSKTTPTRGSRGTVLLLSSCLNLEE